VFFVVGCCKKWDVVVVVAKDREGVEGYRDKDRDGVDFELINP
jgi:hypothetical protein